MRRLAHWIEDKIALLGAGAPLRIGPTAPLALGTYHRWEPEQLYVFVTAYGDESGTHGQSPVMMLAGYVSTLQEWNYFDPQWKRDVLEHFAAKLRQTTEIASSLRSAQ
jgi:hypothetical protein